MVQAWSWTNELEDCAATRRCLNKWRIGKEGPCLANRGRHDEAQYNWHRLLLEEGSQFWHLKSHACM
jgi:hypothetical protein